MFCFCAARSQRDSQAGDCSETFTGLWGNSFRRGTREPRLHEAVVSILVFRCQGEPRDYEEHPRPLEPAANELVMRCECHPPMFGCAPGRATPGGSRVAQDACSLAFSSLFPRLPRGNNLQRFNGNAASPLEFHSPSRALCGCIHLLRCCIKWLWPGGCLSAPQVSQKSSQRCSRRAQNAGHSPDGSLYTNLYL
jgi:hypothetical protein